MTDDSDDHDRGFRPTPEIGHHQSESSVTFERNRRSTWSGIRKIHPTLTQSLKSICDMTDPREILLGRKRRYLEYLSARNDHSAGQCALDRLTEEKREDERPIKALDFFKRTEQHLLRSIHRPEFNIHEMRRTEMMALLSELSTTTILRKPTSAGGSV